MNKLFIVIAAMFCAAAMAVGTNFYTDVLQFGRDVNNNKRLLFKRAGFTPEIRWNEGSGTLQFSNDGSVYADITGTGNGATTVSSGPYTITDTFSTIYLNCTTPFTSTLPNPSGRGGRTFKLKKVDSTLGACTIATAAGSIEGVSTTTLNTVNEELDVNSDDTNWQIMNRRAKTAPFAQSSPTISGWTTANTDVSVWTWRDGRYLRFQGYFTGGNVAGSTIAFAIFGFNGASGNVNNDSAFYTSGRNQPVGWWGSGDTNPGGHFFGPMFVNGADPTKIYFGVSDGGTTPLAQALAQQLGGATNPIRFEGAYLISGWNE